MYWKFDWFWGLPLLVITVVFHVVIRLDGDVVFAQCDHKLRPFRYLLGRSVETSRRN
jgi:hypothetical protein